MSKNNDLFNNPMVEKAIKALSPEELERYKKIGEEMYGSVHFEDSKILNNIPAPMAEAVAYVIESIKSGLHPSDLEENEKILLEDVYGKEWYKKYGYCEKDLTEM